MLRRKPDVDARILQEIGRGGQSTVYSAVDSELGDVAVKVFHLTSEDALDQYKQERNILQKLNDVESIVDVYRSGETQYGEPYLVMQLLKGGSLQDLIDRDGAVPWPQACRYVITATQALHEAHRRGVIHADLKPSNFLLDEQNRPYISDFGISKIVDKDKTTITRIGFTPNYAAPETLTDHEESSFSDIYGLGATTAALIMGQPPFESPGLFRVMEKVVHEPPPTLTDFGAPITVTNVVRKAMAKDPKQRFASAADLGTELETCLDSSQQTKAIKEKNTDWDSQPAEDEEEIQAVPKWRNPKVLAAIAVGLIATLGATIWYVDRLDNPRIVAVEIDGSGDYDTLASAIADIPAGSTVNIGPGFHKVESTIQIKKPLSIIGQGTNESRVIGETEGSVLKATGHPLTLESFTVTVENSDEADVITLDDAPDVRIIGIAVNEGSGNGLIVSGSSSGVIENSTFSSNVGSGLVLADSSTVDIANNSSTGNGDSGFLWLDDATGTATGNNAERNNEEGFLIDGTSQPKLELNTATNNRESGFTWATSGQGSAFNNTATANSGYGFVALDTSSPQLVDNTSSENGKSGYAWRHSSGGTADDNTATNNGFHGFIASDTSDPTIERGEASTNGESGYMWFSTEPGKLTENSATANTKDGFAFGVDANLTEISTNTATDNKRNGFTWFGTISGDVNKNTSRNNQTSGFYFLGLTADSIISQNIAEGNSQYGFHGVELGTIQTNKNQATGNENNDWQELDTSQTPPESN